MVVGGLSKENYFAEMDGQMELLLSTVVGLHQYYIVSDRLGGSHTNNSGVSK